MFSIRNTDCVRCREVVRFSEGPLSEVRLHYDRWVYFGIYKHAEYDNMYNTTLALRK